MLKFQRTHSICDEGGAGRACERHASNILITSLRNSHQVSHFCHGVRGGVCRRSAIAIGP